MAEPADASLEWVEVGMLAEFPEGSGQSVQLGNRPVAVFNVGGTLFACKNLCPHQGDALHTGRVENGAVICAGHDWGFDLTSGECTSGGGVVVGARVRTYPVRVDAGRVSLGR
jgi:nitrite reductase/ring-hydroxylating ferredoxin subunit